LKTNILLLKFELLKANLKNNIMKNLREEGSKVSTIEGREKLAIINPKNRD